MDDMGRKWLRLPSGLFLNLANLVSFRALRQHGEISGGYTEVAAAEESDLAVRILFAEDAAALELYLESCAAEAVRP